MALATDGDVVVFVLYRRGVYGIGLNADEHWRMPPPEWSYPKKTSTKRRNRGALHRPVKSAGSPREAVESSGDRSTQGQLLEEHLLDHAEAPIEHHFKHESHDLLCSTDGMVTWLHRMEPVKHARLSGPVQGRSVRFAAGGWRIAGWREEVVIHQR